MVELQGVNPIRSTPDVTNESWQALVSFFSLLIRIHFPLFLDIDPLPSCREEHSNALPC